MQMIIDIDEKVYNDIIKGETYDSFYNASLEAVNAITGGTPIQKADISEEEKFQKFLYNNNISSDRMKYNFEDGKLITLDLSACNIEGKISFKDFPNLKVLDLAYNNITDIDLTKNFKLTELYLQKNNLTNVDLTKNCNLEYLRLGYNNLTNIDLTKNFKLTELFLQYNKITNIDLTQNLNLGELDLEGNNLTIVDLTHNTELYELYIDPNAEMRITGDMINRIVYRD